MSTGGRLDPDALAALEEERDFLLRSLDDLEAERAAGDIDDTDFTGLHDDYTRRAAEVLRAIDEQRRAFEAVPRRSPTRIAAWVVGLALLGALAGWALARSSGDRLEGEGITGGVRQSIVTRLSEAQRLFATADEWPAAVEIYDGILDEDPTNTEALTYRAWLQYRLGDPLEQSLAQWEEAGRIDPGYADRIVFHAIALSDAGLYADAATVLDDLDIDASAPIIGQLVQGRGLRGEVYGEARYDQLVAADEPTLAELGLDIETALEAAGYIFASDKPERSIVTLKLLRAVQAVEPDNAAALSREAFLLAQTGDAELIDRALALVDKAVEAHPDDVEALVTRASLLAASDVDGACADVDRVRALTVDADPQDALAARAASLADQLGC